MKLALFLIATVALADPVAVTWSGSPVTTDAYCPGCPYGVIPPVATAYDDGLNADLAITYSSSAWGPGPSSGSTVSTPFELSSPADVMLALTVNYGASGTSCGDEGCNTTDWEMDGGFSGSASIWQGSTLLDTVPFGASGSVDGQCSFMGCTADLELSDAESGQLFLDTGTYTLVTTYADGDSSVGDSGAGAKFFAVLSDPEAVPEPDSLSLVVALLGVTLAGLWVNKKVGKL